MSRLFLDTNALIDLFVARLPDVHQSLLQVVRFCSEGTDELLVGANSISDATSIIENGRQFREVIPDKKLRRQLASNLRRVSFHYATICSVNGNILKAAHRNAAEEDFEDALIAECAKAHKADFIVSSDKHAFLQSAVPKISPSECAGLIGGGSEN